MVDRAMEKEIGGPGYVNDEELVYYETPNDTKSFLMDLLPGQLFVVINFLIFLGSLALIIE